MPPTDHSSIGIDSGTPRIPRVQKRLRRILIRLAWVPRPFIFIGIYAFWTLFVRLLSLTIITYFTISPTSHFQDISDAFSSNEVTLMGLSAFLFVGLHYWFNPLSSASLSEMLNRTHIEKNFLPGFIYGAFFAGTTILIFILSGTYQYLGYFIQLNEAPLEILNVLLRTLALIALAYCEGFIFFDKILGLFHGKIKSDWVAPLIAVLYCGIKTLQFDLGIMHLVSLFLLCLSLYYRCRKKNQFARGAGFWAAVLIVFHPLLSLPIFGNSFSGILLVKYHPISPLLEIKEKSIDLNRLLTGGVGGPLSSFTFQLLLILDIGRSIVRQKNRFKERPNL